MDAPPARPLVVASSAAVLDDLLRLSAAAGVEVDVVSDPGAARGRWATAAAVVVEAELVADLLRLGMPRRPGVVVVCTDEDDAAVWRLAVGVGAEQVAVLPDADAWLLERLAVAAATQTEGAVVGVVGGRGGAGASTFAAALALSAVRRGWSAALVDADPLGGGVDLLLGAEDAGGARWPDLGDLRGRVAPAVLADALLTVDGVHVVSWDRSEVSHVSAEAMRAVLDPLQRSHDLVVVDLPRRPDEAARCVLRLARPTLLVVPAEVRACAAAGRVAAAIAPDAAEVALVVRGPSPSGLSSAAVVEALGLPLAARMRAEPGLAAALEHGGPPMTPRGPLARACARVLDGVAGPGRPPEERRGLVGAAPALAS